MAKENNIEEKEELLRMVNILLDNIMDTSTYMQLLFYYKFVVLVECAKAYSVSPIFHEFVRQSFVFSMIMNLGKLFENPNQHRAVNLKQIVDYCEKHSDVFPEGMNVLILKDDRNYLNNGKFADILEYVNKQNSSLNTVSLPFDLGIKFFRFKLHQCENAKDKVIKLRNNVYAHNDGSDGFDVDKFLDSVSLKWTDVAQMLDIAYCICYSIHYTIDKSVLPRDSSTGTDIASMFRMLEMGLKYESKLQKGFNANLESNSTANIRELQSTIDFLGYPTKIKNVVCFSDTYVQMVKDWQEIIHNRNLNQ